MPARGTRAEGKKILAWSKSANQFYREIGERLKGKLPRIYLGDDERAARANVVRLEGLWQGVEARWADYQAEQMADTDRPVWDDTTLLIAEAVGRGSFKVVVEPPQDVKDGFDLAVWVANLHNYLPQIQISLTPELAATATEASKEFIDLAERDAGAERSRHQREMRGIKEYAAAYEGKIRTQETLYDALDAYVRWLHDEHRDVEGTTTDTGVKQGERATRVKRHVKDMPLSNFGLDQINALFEYWRKRPRQDNGRMTHGRPFSYSLFKHTITLIRHFLRWLHKDPSMPWKKPADLDLRERVKIVKDTKRAWRRHILNTDINTPYAPAPPPATIPMPLPVAYAVARGGRVCGSGCRTGGGERRTAVSEQSMSEALDVIHDEPLRLLELDISDEVERGLELILSIARYKFNVSPRSPEPDGGPPAPPKWGQR